MRCILLFFLFLMLAGSAFGLENPTDTARKISFKRYFSIDQNELLIPHVCQKLTENCYSLWQTDSIKKIDLPEKTFFFDAVNVVRLLNNDSLFFDDLNFSKIALLYENNNQGFKPALRSRVYVVFEVDDSLYYSVSYNVAFAPKNEIKVVTKFKPIKLKNLNFVDSLDKLLDRKKPVFHSANYGLLIFEKNKIVATKYIFSSFLLNDDFRYLFIY